MILLPRHYGEERDDEDRALVDEVGMKMMMR
jgi:hypothetical protein